ncbi:MAG: glycosyltransferase family 9 protein [Betaproteobacteria bacterium]|nr:glycosyltransferase family 9 protein [Betaproteobacteria bacterium]
MIPPRQVLVVVTRRIGDVLLATPLIRSLQRAWPQTRIDALVFAGTEGVLAANPDLRRVITIAERPSLWQHLALLASIARRYDIALSLVPSDRPTLYAAIAGRWRAGLVVDTPKHRWKKWLLNRWTAFDNLNVHTVLMNLKLTESLDIPPCHEVVAAWDAADESHVSALLAARGNNRPFAVLHLYPKFNYKMWRDEAWLDCARALAARGLALVLTGSADVLERAYVGRLAAAMPGAIDLAGQLTLAQAACLIARARLYVGPDTALTHLAAASGVSTIAFYGPTDPVKWGPWPQRYSGPGNPWRRVGSQTHGNVCLIQGVQACAPCLKEGCDRHVASFSDCLLGLPPGRVIAAAENLLGGTG